MSPEEFHRLLVEQHGILDVEQCRRLWRILGRDDEPPTSMEVVFSRQDVLRAFPPRTAYDSETEED
jgi:hypothetical protein